MTLADVSSSTANVTHVLHTCQFVRNSTTLYFPSSVICSSQSLVLNLTHSLTRTSKLAAVPCKLSVTKGKKDEHRTANSRHSARQNNQYCIASILNPVPKKLPALLNIGGSAVKHEVGNYNLPLYPVYQVAYIYIKIVPRLVKGTVFAIPERVQLTGLYWKHKGSQNKRYNSTVSFQDYNKKRFKGLKVA